MRILLDEQDFIKLISGGIVEKDGVKIALSDIGWDRMVAAINSAINREGLKHL